MQVKTILLPTDLSPSAEPTLDFAVALADQFGAELRILHATIVHSETPTDPLYHMPSLENILDRVNQEVMEEMAEMLRSHRERPLKVKEIVRRGFSAAPVILDEARQDVDLIVIGTHGRRGLPRFFLGSVAEEVVRHAPCPVFTLRHHEKKATTHPKKILLATDFSPCATAALKHATAFAHLDQSELHLLHVVEEVVWPEIYGPGGAHFLTSQRDIRRKAGLGELQRTEDEELQGLNVTLHCVHGHPSEAILEHLKSLEPDLLVLGSRGTSGLGRLLLGSTAEVVVRSASCPVLTVKCDGRNLV